MNINVYSVKRNVLYDKCNNVLFIYFVNTCVRL